MFQKQFETSRAELYELYWGQQLSFREIGEKFNTTRQTIARRFTEYEIPSAPRHNHELFIFRHRSRQYLYDLYWGQDQTLTEITDQFPFSYNTVKQHYHKANIPLDSPTRVNRWYDKDRGIPAKYKLPSDVPQPKYGEIPENPDGSKYMAETPLHRDKDRLYQLYWGYGLSASQIKARCEYDVNVKQHMRELGIPVRNYHEHKRWKPYLGVPPMFEFSEENSRSSSSKNNNDFEWSFESSCSAD